ncbi:MAG: sel1 repeat family protein, partial [Gammaproteobacteria bacterium]|nr:sel1 repeat family protein [Gammaproteobacteria bacterium]
MAMPLPADEGTALPAWEKDSATNVSARLKARAEQGDAETQNRLGNMYYHGDGIQKNHKLAAHWFDKAAEQGYAPGQFNLARLYRQGKGVEQDYGRAVHWYRKAAEQGLVIAQFFLGKSYAEGQGISKDPILAYRWLHRAAIQGDADAQWARDRLLKTLSPQQLAEVQARNIAKTPKRGATEIDKKKSGGGGGGGG